MIMAVTTDFKLISFLTADARRHHAIYSNANVSPGRLRLLLVLISPRFAPVLLCRLAHGAYCLHLAPIGKVISLLNFIVFGIEISVQCPIGRGLILPHTQGTVIGASTIGENVTIFQGVTLGAKELDIAYNENCRPTIGCGVTLGAGSKVLGDVVIGDFSFVGANSVVLDSMPSNVIAAGIPAKVIKTIESNS